jgi:hypothetical protein
MTPRDVGVQIPTPDAGAHRAFGLGRNPPPGVRTIAVGSPRPIDDGSTTHPGLVGATDSVMRPAAVRGPLRYAPDLDVLPAVSFARATFLARRPHNAQSVGAVRPRGVHGPGRSGRAGVLAPWNLVERGSGAPPCPARSTERDSGSDDGGSDDGGSDASRAVRPGTFARAANGGLPLSEGHARRLLDSHDPCVFLSRSDPWYDRWRCFSGSTASQSRVHTALG